MRDKTAPLPPDPTSAQDALQRADMLAARAARQARWVPLYLAGFAVASGALTLLVGSAEDLRDIVAPISGAVVFAGCAAAIASSQPVRGGVPRRVYLAGWIGSGLLHIGALAAGTLLDWSLWAWAIASLVVATPLALAARTIQRLLR